MAPDHSFECNAPDVVFENFGDEVIVLNLQSGNYYSLDPVGMLYWEYLSQGVHPSEIAAHVRSRYAGAAEASIDHDLEAFLLELETEGLVRPSRTRRALAEATAASTILPPQYSRPVLSKFEDVAEMLLLDPVHDVSEVGWPHPAPPSAQRASGEVK
jgi:hypothetical protein